MEPCAHCPVRDEPGVVCYAVRRNSRHECELAAFRADYWEDIRARSLGVEPAVPAQIHGSEPAPARTVATRRGPCAFLGAAVVGADGKAETVECATCSGNVRLKVLGCGHPGHDGRTTEMGCRSCSDWEGREEEVVVVGVGKGDPVMNYWRGG
jgi:hypothetical protein